MEIFLLKEGKAHISFINSEHDLQPGEGYFTNANVLHGISNPTKDVCHYYSIVFDPCIMSGIPGSAYDILYIRPFMEHGCPALIFRPDDNLNGKMISEFFQTAFDACRKENMVTNLLFVMPFHISFCFLKEYAPETPHKQPSQRSRALLRF